MPNKKLRCAYICCSRHLHKMPGAFFVFRPGDVTADLSIGALVKGGIVAPTKVVRVASQHAAWIAGRRGLSPNDHKSDITGHSVGEVQYLRSEFKTGRPQFLLPESV